MLLGGLEAGPLDSDGPLIDGGVDGIGGVECASRLPHAERVGVLVHHVGGDAGGGAPGGLVEGLDGEAVMVDGDQHAAAAGIGGAQPAALGDLAGVPGGSCRHAPLQWNGGYQRGVGRPARKDDLGTVIDRGGDRFVAHETDDVRAAQQGGLVEWPGGLERADARLPEKVGERSRVLFGVDACAPARDTALGGYLGEDAVYPVDACVGARGTAGADDHGDPCLIGGRDNVAQIPGDGSSRGLRRRGAEVVRT